MKFRSSIPVVAAVAALAAGPATATTQYKPFETDFPNAAQVNERYIPGVTDFPRTGPTVSPVSITASDDGIEWGDTTIAAALGTALGLGLVGSALMIRRRSTLAHS